MVRGWKRLVTIVMTVVLICNSLPTAAFASLVTNEPQTNNKILGELEELVGSKEEAQTYYTLLEQYGLLDGEGNIAESWTIERDGKPAELEDIRTELAGDYDPDDTVTVDGTMVRLEDLATMLEIEDYISQLREKYFSQGEWTQEQVDALESLKKQIDTEGIQIKASGEGITFPSGIDHNARVSMSVTYPTDEDDNPLDYVNANGGGTVTVKFSLSGGTDEHPVTFTVQTLEGSAQEDVDYKKVEQTVTLTPKNSAVEIPVKVVDRSASLGDKTFTDFDMDYWNGSRTFWLRAADIKNGLFVQGAERVNTLAKQIDIKMDEAVSLADGLPSIESTDKTQATVKIDDKMKWQVANGIVTNLAFSPVWPSLIDPYETSGGGITSTRQGPFNWKHQSTWSNSNTGDFGYTPEYWILDGYSLSADGKALYEAPTQGYDIDEMKRVVDDATDPNKGGQLSYDIGNLENLTEYLIGDVEPEGKVSIEAQAYSIPDDLQSTMLTSNELSMMASYRKIWYDRGNREVAGPSDGTTFLRFKFEITDETAPELTGLSVPADVTFVPGDVIPIAAEFSEPVLLDSVKLGLQGKDDQTVELSAYGADEEKAFSSRVTFLYEVPAVDGNVLRVMKISFADLHNNEVALDNNASKEEEQVPPQFREVARDQITAPLKLDAITDMTAEIDSSTILKPTLEVSVQISGNETATAWLGDDLVENPDTGLFESQSLKLSLDGGKTFHTLALPKGVEEATNGTLTASISIDPNLADEAVTRVAELYLDGTVVVGRYAAKEQAPAKFVTASDINDLSVSVKKGDEEYKYENPDKPVIYLQDGPSIEANFTLNGDGFTFGDTTKTTVWKTDDAGNRVPDDPDAHFVWEVTNPAVANIDKTGKVTTTGVAGTTKIKLTALNGGIEGRQASKESEELTFGVGLTPFLLIPNADIQTQGGKDVTVFWSSNLCEKNGATPTEFSVKMTRGDKEVWSSSVTGTKEKPVASVLIPKEKLDYVYAEGASNTCKVTVSSTYDKKTYEATATITLSPGAAHVSLGKLRSYYVLDTQGSVDISWDVTNFDRYTAAGADGKGNASLFEFMVTRDGVEKAVATSDEPGTEFASGSYAGRYTLKLEDVKANDDPTSYRHVYTVTVKAKNGSDSTWSNDSFVLYVYDANALQILMGGKEAGANAIMSNREKFSKMKQEEILKLNREINLRDVISINYGEYAWAEIADQISWSSSDSSVASVNYQKGTLYDNIENFDYTSYRPTTDFVLSGLKDGSTTVTAEHKLTEMTDSVDVTVETMKDRLYLFQCYPQTTTKLTFEEWADADHTKTERTEIISDTEGAAAYYAEFGIASDVWCESTVGEGDDKQTYMGTFYLSQLQTGERDSTKLELYPCNNLQLRRAAFAYLYLKNPDGTAYSGDMTFRGGVYVNGEYKEGAQFRLNGAEGSTSLNAGNKDQTIRLGDNGRLEVVMDQTQWGLEDDSVKAGDTVEYVFQIEQGDGKQTEYYPLLVTVNGSVNEDAFVGSGSAIVNFRKNDGDGKHPFIASQIGLNSEGGYPVDMIGNSGTIGPSDNSPDTSLITSVMWWGKGKDEVSSKDSRVELTTWYGQPIATKPGEFVLKNTAYPFTDILITQHKAQLNEATMTGMLGSGGQVLTKLNYYADGETLTRSETMPFKLCNMLGMGRIEEQSEISTMLNEMSGYATTDTDEAGKMDFGDQFFGTLLKLVADDDYNSEGGSVFSIQLAPTADPTTFLGFIEVNVGNMSDDTQINGVYATPGTQHDFDYMPGLGETMMLVGAKTPFQYAWDQMDDFFKSTKNKGVRNISFDLGGYAESMIYYNAEAGKWEVQILDGGFNAGGGLSYSWNFNTWCGPVPITATLTAGGTAEVDMDAITVAYGHSTYGMPEDDYSGLGTDFLTELRLYLYLRFFAGVGFDYAIVAFKLGVFGQVNADIAFDWLSRPCLSRYAGDNYNKLDGGRVRHLSGQHYQIDGAIGLEFLVKLLCISYETALFSTSFNFLDKTTGEWEKLNANWDANASAIQETIEDMVDDGSASLVNAGGQQMVALNMAPTVESRDYLADGGRSWGPGWSFFGLGNGGKPIQSLETNTYPFANPVVSNDGALVAYLSDNGSENVEDTRIKVGTRAGESYEQGMALPKPATDENEGYGDSQVALSGTNDFAVAAWTRQTQPINKEAGSKLTEDDQMMMLDSSDVYASVRMGGNWTSTRLSDTAGADLAPVVATNGKTGDGARAIVAWRSVASSGTGKAGAEGNQLSMTDFDQRDTIVYRVYNGATNEWSAPEQTLYNGTSGAVKALVATMMDDGTAAVAYTLDTDGNETTTADREIAYAVVGKDSDVTRSVQVTTDNYLDENPQIAAVKFGDEQRFVLGWYAEEAAASDAAAVLSGSAASDAAVDKTSDIRLIDFDATGSAGQKLPDSINQVADSYGVNISSNFRFAKNAQTIDDLSILWVERAEAELVDVEDAKDKAEGDGTGEGGGESKVELEADHDLLRAVKFYRAGEKKELVRLTGAIDLADMKEAAEGTVIDHFDAYVSSKENNGISAVILASTYGSNGATTTHEGETITGKKVSYAVPKRTTGMYTASENYSDVLEVPNLVVDWETVRLGGTAQFQFTIENAGIHAINAVNIKVSDTETKHTDLNLMPGDSIQLRADYEVPDDKVVDPEWTVTATFDSASGATGAAETGATNGFFGIGATTGTNQVTGTAYLDLPDVEITEAAIVSKQDGKRVIQAKLNNHADAALAKSGRAVRLGFYTDAACEVPLKSVGEDGFVTIDDDENLAMLDEGGYALQETFDIAKFMTDKDGNVTEIPEGGVAVYLKAEVLDVAGEDGERAVQGEPITSDNYGSVRAENLAVSTGEEVSITTDLANDGKNTTVSVRLQNNRLATKTTGNLIVMLLDKDGNVIAEQQSYRKGAPNNGLITLAGEQIATEKFTFKGVTGAVDVRVTYSDAVLDGSNADLETLTVDGIELERTEGTDDVEAVFTGSMTDLPRALVTVVAANPASAVAVTGPDGKPIKFDTEHTFIGAFGKGENTFTITVTAPDGTRKVYKLVLNHTVTTDNTDLADLSVSGIELTYDAASKTFSGSGTSLKSGKLTLKTADPRATVTVNGEPYTEGMLLTFAKGENVFEIVVTAADGTTTTTYRLVIDNKVPGEPEPGEPDPDNPDTGDPGTGDSDGSDHDPGDSNKPGSGNTGGDQTAKPGDNATDKTDGAQTLPASGDNAPLFAIAALAGAGAVILAVGIYLRRRPQS